MAPWPDQVPAGVYYIYVDSYYAIGHPASCGPYTLTAQGTVPVELMDFYRGRQVWIEHGDGTIARYAHLSEIAEGIREGAAVAQGQEIGKIGNTGSPASINGPDEDAHLHFELWRGETYLGQYLRPVESRELILALFGLDG